MTIGHEDYIILQSPEDDFMGTLGLNAQVCWTVGVIHRQIDVPIPPSKPKELKGPAPRLNT